MSALYDILDKADDGQEDGEPVILRITARQARTLRDTLEYERTFDLRWKADQRAIERWRKAHPDAHVDLVMPDHADLCVWVLEERDKIIEEVAKSFEQLAENGTEMERIIFKVCAGHVRAMAKVDE